MTTLAVSFPRESPNDRAAWFGVFVAVSVAAHAAFLVHARWERHTAEVGATPSLMAVQLVEVASAPPKPVAAPASPPAAVAVDESEPVITRNPEPEIVPPPSVQPRVQPKPASPKVERAAAASPKAAAPALVEARPSARGNRPPNYPEMARRNGWQGLCMVRVAVTAQGRAGVVSLARSSGYGVLDQAALAAVKRWSFTPRMVRGNAVGCTVEVPVNFSLR
ncbi:MAG: energy transducer TonB [Chthoniobacterales bacterium]|nr:energy transducer TonB [Chthoniobacterales bacterium]